jgi:hypothetical protein
MKINFTKKQYEDLMKLVYLGAWMINSHRTDNIEESYEELEQYILSFSEEFGTEKYVEFDEELNRFFTTREFEEDTEIEQYKEEYDDNTFWDELIYRLARRDLIKTYGEAAVFTMTTDELLDKEQPFIDRYEMEFERHGIDNLEIKERAGYMFFETKGNA